MNVAVIREEAMLAARDAFPMDPDLTPIDVHVSGEDEVFVYLRAKDGRARWARLLGPLPGLEGFGRRLRFDFTDLGIEGDDG